VLKQSKLQQDRPLYLSFGLNFFEFIPVFFVSTDQGVFLSIQYKIFTNQSISDMQLHDAPDKNQKKHMQ